MFVQSIFVKAALNSVFMGGLCRRAHRLDDPLVPSAAGGRTFFLASIPPSIVTAILVLYVAGQTFNTMTLGGFALAWWASWSAAMPQW